MKVLIFTHMYPSPKYPEYGIFVQQQVASLRREGIDIDVLYINVKDSKWRYLWSFIPLTKQILTHHYDLVHAHYVFAGIVARSQFRYPIVLTHHGAEAIWGWQAPLCKIISRLVDRTIVVSEQVKSSIRLAGSVTIPCGVDFELFKPCSQQLARKELGLPSDRKLVLFAGRYLDRLKRFDIVQEAVDCLRSRGVNVDLIIASNQPYEKVPIYMNACDVLVLASEYEGSPQVVKEAMACNLPVVSVNVGDVPNILEGVNGCYICPRDPISIAEKVQLVLDRGIRTNGREKTQRYELSVIARQIIQVYRETLEGKKVPSFGNQLQNH